MQSEGGCEAYPHPHSEVVSVPSNQVIEGRAYLKEAICSPANTEPEVGMPKTKGNVHQGCCNQASCRRQHHMGLNIHV